MMEFLKNIAINCEQATLLAEKRRASKLSWSEGLGLHIHLGYCSLCRLFIAQSDLLGRAAKLFSQKVESGQLPFKLNSNLKMELAKKLEQEIG